MGRWTMRGVWAVWAAAVATASAQLVCVAPFTWTSACSDGCGQYYRFDSRQCYDGPYLNVGNFTVESITPVTAGNIQFSAGEITCCSECGYWLGGETWTYSDNEVHQGDWNRTVTSTFNVPGVKLMCGSVPGGCQIRVSYCIEVVGAATSDVNVIVTDFKEAADGSVVLGKTRTIDLALAAAL